MQATPPHTPFFTRHSWGQTWITLCLLLGSLILSAAHAATGKRLALVIGNDSYQYTSVLQNARADARAMANKLQTMGFTVTLQENLNEKEMKRTLRQFKSSVGGGDEVVFFYSGHGVELENSNYLLPTDIKGENPDQVKDEAVPLQRILADLADQRARFSLAIIDACRNNPFKGSGRAIGGRGLAPVTAATGQMIIYSAGAGQEALDRLGNKDPERNGVFTRVLLKEMSQPGRQVGEVLRRVRQEVATMAKTVGHEQVPALYDQALGDFYFLGPVNITVQPPAANNTQSVAQADPDQELWSTVKNSTQPQDFEDYLQAFPQGRFAASARVRLRQLRTVATTEPAAQPALQPVPRVPTNLATTTAAATTTPSYPPGQTFRDCPDCPLMTVIPEGSFMMGSPASEADRQNSEGPQHRVFVSRFAMAKMELTRGLFAKFLKSTGYNMGNSCMAWTGSKWEYVNGNTWQYPGYVQQDSHPATCLNWNDAQAYVTWLSQQTGKTYRLPTEAEWEYAARAGTGTARFWGDSPHQACAYSNSGDEMGKRQVPGASNWLVANCDDGYAYTSPVGIYQANPFGLHDMLGNVLEWVQDCYVENYNNAPNNGAAVSSGSCGQRIVRGGAWNSAPGVVRAAQRVNVAADLRNYIYGIRVVRSVP